MTGNIIAHTCINAFHRFLFRFDEALAFVFAYVKPQEVETLVDVRNPGFLWREL